MSSYEHPGLVAGLDAARREVRRLEKSLLTAQQRGDSTAARYLGKRLTAANTILRRLGRGAQ